MKAVILLKANAGSEGKAYAAVKRDSPKGTVSVQMMHLFGRYDGVIVCECETLEGLNAYAEQLREDGVFQTETLICVD